MKVALNVACICLNWLFCLSLHLFWLLIQLVMKRKECWTNGMQAILPGRDHHLPLLLYTPECVMSDAAFHHHYDQQSASAWFGFTHSAPMAGFIVLAAYLFMYSYYAHLLQYRRPFRSRTTATMAKLITFLCNKCLSVTPIWLIDLLPVWPPLYSISPWYAHSWELVGAC